MKKFFAITLLVCLLASALCLTVFAAEPTALKTASDSEMIDRYVTYAELIVAVVGLIAAIVSVVLITRSNKKKANKKEK